MTVGLRPNRLEGVDLCEVGQAALEAGEGALRGAGLAQAVLDVVGGQPAEEPLQDQPGSYDEQLTVVKLDEGEALEVIELPAHGLQLRQAPRAQLCDGRGDEGEHAVDGGVVKGQLGQVGAWEPDAAVESRGVDGDPDHYEVAQRHPGGFFEAPR